MKDHITHNPRRIYTSPTQQAHPPLSMARHTHNELHWLCERGQHMGINWNVPWNVQHDLGGNVLWSCYHGNLLPNWQCVFADIEIMSVAVIF